MTDGPGAQDRAGYAKGLHALTISTPTSAPRLRIASDVTGEVRGSNDFCQYRHELRPKHGLAEPPRRPQLDRYDGLVVVAGQENERHAALAQGKGDREATVRHSD